MEPIYIDAESTVKPNSIEIQSATVYLRRDVTEFERENGDGTTTTFYSYKEAKMTPEEFNQYTNQLSAINALKGVNNADNILQILTGQQNGDTNQMTIMEALADLYEAVAMIGGV